MKLRIIAIALTAIAVLPASADVSVTDTNTAAFNFGGIISPMCKVKGTSSTSASSLTINQTNTTQDIGTLEVWCNTGRNASTKYASANNGFLVDGANKIPYTLGVGNVAENIDLANEYTNNDTEAGSAPNGTGKTHALKITPQSNGLDNAGQYSDTITVTVAYN